MILVLQQAVQLWFLTYSCKGKSPDIQQTNLQESHNVSPGWRMAGGWVLDFNIMMWQPLFS